LVELVALRVASDRPLRFGLIAGALIGTVGLAAEWAWSHVFMPIPWPGELLPQAAVLAFAMAIAGAMIGAWIGARLASDRIPRTRAQRYAGVAGAAAVAAMVAVALIRPADSGITATVALDTVQGPPQREVNATVTLDPPDAADDAKWLSGLSWQGGGLVLDEQLRRVGPGVYRTNEPLPVHGSWKTLIRRHEGSSLTAIPVFLPYDAAIPAEGVPAPPEFSREFVGEKEILQREVKSDAGAIWNVAYGVVILITLGFLSLVAWGLHRLAVTAERPQTGDSTTAAPSRPRSRAGRPASVVS
jgi:hypothetical protein